MPEPVTLAAALLLLGKVKILLLKAKAAYLALKVKAGLASAGFDPSDCNVKAYAIASMLVNKTLGNSNKDVIKAGVACGLTPPVAAWIAKNIL